jgi:hypothetical protein
MCRLQSNAPNVGEVDDRSDTNGSRNPGCFDDGSPSWVEYHAPFFGGSRATALIWIMCGDPRLPDGSRPGLCGVAGLIPNFICVSLAAADDWSAAGLAAVSF